MLLCERNTSQSNGLFTQEVSTPATCTHQREWKQIEYVAWRLHKSTGESELARNLNVIASLVNANLTGTRIYATVQGGYDTHENQRYDLEQKLLPDLDASLDAFFAALANPQQVVVMVWTEFGRRPHANVSGTDHGAANDVIVIGPRVRGDVYGAQPSFDPLQLDSHRNLRGSTAFESVYAELIDAFLGGDSRGVLGGTFAPVGVLR